MKELLRSNDPVLASFVGSLLRDADIEFFRFDENMSVMEGSIGALPQRFSYSLRRLSLYHLGGRCSHVL